MYVPHILTRHSHFIRSNFQTLVLHIYLDYVCLLPGNDPILYHLVQHLISPLLRQILVIVGGVGGGVMVLPFLQKNNHLDAYAASQVAVLDLWLLFSHWPVSYPHMASPSLLVLQAK